MNRDEVERLLKKSQRFWKKHIQAQISIVDLHALSDQIWREMLLERKKDKPCVEVNITKSELEDIEHKGSLIYKGDGYDVHLVFLEEMKSTMVTESGKMINFGKKQSDKEK
jgi:hypothetical protein